MTRISRSGILVICGAAVGILALAGFTAWLVWNNDGSIQPASSQNWTPLAPDRTYSSDRGFALSGPDRWFVVEPEVPPDSELVAVLSTGETFWQNGADQQLPIIYILHHNNPDGPQAVALWYPSHTWAPLEIDGAASLKTGWEPDSSTTWGGRIWLISHSRDVWEIRALVPEGQAYESTQEDVDHMLESFSVHRGR